MAEALLLTINTAVRVSQRSGLGRAKRLHAPKAGATARTAWLLNWPPARGSLR